MRRHAADFAVVIKLSPKFAPADFGRGQVDAQPKKQDLAVIDFTEAIQLKTTDFDAFRARTVSGRAPGKIDLSEQDLAEAKEWEEKAK